jgi:hypothetical protein
MRVLNVDQVTAPGLMFCVMRSCALMIQGRQVAVTTVHRHAVPHTPALMM